MSALVVGDQSTGQTVLEQAYLATVVSKLKTAMISVLNEMNHPWPRSV